MSQVFPHDETAELGLLCAICHSPETVLPPCLTQIKPEHFHIAAHRTLFAVLVEMFEAKIGIDESTLIVKLRNKHVLEEIGGTLFLGRVLSTTPSSVNYPLYLATLCEKHSLRQILQACRKTQDAIFLPECRPESVIGNLSSEVTRIATQGQQKARRTFQDAMMDKVCRMEEDQFSKNLLKTGIIELDIKSPLSLGDMPLIAGKRKAGKSIFSLTVAMNLVKAGHRGLYFSLEDREEKVVDRIVAGESGVAVLFHNNRTTQGNINAIVAATGRLVECPFSIRDDVFELQHILAIIRNEKNLFPNLAFVVVDYAQLVRGVRGKNDSREQEVANVSRSLRLLAMELNVAIIVLSQLNKEGDSRESTALENDATAMWRIGQITKSQGKDKPPLVEEGVRSIEIPFQRNGDSGVYFKVAFRGHVARVENIEQD